MSACCSRVSSGSAASPATNNQIPRRDPISAATELSLLRKRLIDAKNQPQGIVVMKTRRPSWVFEAVPSGGGWVSEQQRSEGGGDRGKEEKKKASTVCSYAVSDDQNKVGGGRREEVVVAAALTVVLGVGNRVLYKLALVPLKHYPFFLAQLATFGYVIVYFYILHLRYHAGLVTDEMLSLPKSRYLAVGLLEALGAVAGMAAGELSYLATAPVIHFPWAEI